MENLITAKTKWLRGVSFAFYILILASSIFLAQLVVNAFIPYYDYEASRYTPSLVHQTFYAILWFGFSLPLIFIASTKYTKSAFIVLTSLYGLRLICMAVLTGLAFAGLCSLSAYNTISGAFLMMLPLIAAYLLSVIINSTTVESKTKKWIVLIIVSYTLTFINWFVYAIYGAVVNMKGLEYNQQQTFFASPVYMIWMSYIFAAVKAVAYFKFIYSPLFDGSYDPNIKGNYNPLNKYFLGIIGAAAVGLAGLFAVYYFCL